MRYDSFGDERDLFELPRSRNLSSDPICLVVGCQLLVSRVTGHLLLARFHVSGFGVNQDFRAECYSVSKRSVTNLDGCEEIRCR
jgi:hypothetical protein